MPATPLLASALAKSGEANQYGELIAELERKQDWTGLAALAETRIAADRKSSEWWVIYGYAELQMRDYPRATAAFTRSTEVSPEDVDGWNMLGEAQRLSGQPGRAVQTLGRALAIDPTSPMTRFLLGEASRDDGRLERAKAHYRDALRLDQKYAPALFGLATVLMRTGPANEYQATHDQLQKADPVLAEQLRGLQKARAGASPRR
ncbi:MAG: tetratricopeptide repeat protein [Betaproteobacteria bacterium]|nr:tetratricopeptide repeat protein [Betaproteobacteria bacterium]